MIYLDNSATSRPFDTALDAMRAAEFFNPSSLYEPAMRGEEALARMRAAVLSALKLHTEEWLVTLTSGGTEADNLAILGAARALRGRKGHFVSSSIEHPAVLMSLGAVRDMGHDVTLIAPGADGVVRPEALDAVLRGDTVFVSIMHVNNETGARQPVEALARLTKQRCPRAIFHCDGVQGFLRDTIRLGDVDLYTVSAHKVHGPKGVGALARKKNAKLLPILYGGGQEDGMRSGTENTVGAAGFAAAVSEFARMPDAIPRLREMKLRLWRGVADAFSERAGFPAIQLNGPAPDGDEAAPHILNMSFPVPGEVLLHALEGEGILVSTRSACSSRRREKSGPLHAMGLSPARIDGAIRFSLSPQNTPEEIGQTIDAIKRIIPDLLKYRRN